MRTLYKFIKTGIVSAVFMQAGFAQKDNVGIGTTKPDQSAILDLSSTNKGLLMPRVTLQQRSSILNPANGLIVYQTDMLSGFYYFDGKGWQAVGANTAQNSVADDPTNWSKTGNLISATDFIGTTNGQSLTFKVANEKAGQISTNGSAFLGQYSGYVNTGANNVGIGSYTLFQNNSGLGNVAIGSGSMLNTTTGSSGNYNVGLGFQALKNNRGNDNIGIGTFALTDNTTGNSNVAVGPYAGYKNQTGEFNFAFGPGALLENISGSNNVAIGPDALRFVTGSENTGIGRWAGRNATGSSNVFIGQSAGSNETSSNKLYISNSNTTTPLVYGDFSAKFVAIGDVTASNAKRDGLAAQYGLLVQKGILTEKIKVATMTSTDWADYVFEKDYQRMSLEEVEKFVKENKHLPNVPTTQEMMTSGSDLIKTDAKLLEKIEELTLYMIEMNKEIKALKEENMKLKK
jgi:hypothetical protein